MPDCRRLDLPGYRHHTSVTRDVVSAASLDECSLECGHAADYCRTFSFNEADALDNCVLSALKATDIIMNQGRFYFTQSNFFAQNPFSLPFNILSLKFCRVWRLFIF